MNRGQKFKLTHYRHVIRHLYKSNESAFREFALAFPASTVMMAALLRSQFHAVSRDH